MENDYYEVHEDEYITDAEREEINKEISRLSEEVQESGATSCKFCGSNKSDIRMNSIVCSGCGRKIGNVATLREGDF